MTSVVEGFLGVRAKAKIEIDFPLPRLGFIVAKAIHPELENSPADRFNAKLTVKKEGKINICISATDTSALRAALNSYLYWVSAIDRTLNLFTELMRKS